LINLKYLKCVILIYSENKKNINTCFIIFFVVLSRACSGKWHWSIAGLTDSIAAGIEWSSERDCLYMENCSQVVFHAVIFLYLFLLRPKLQEVISDG
jgi:hypothetical protein